ncbi:MAG: hypothetical protein AB2L20_06215 [Mangrovibacterium sp.]
MRKKSGLTIVVQAIVLVPEFEKVAGKPLPLPGVQNRKDDRCKRTAADTFTGTKLFLQTCGLLLNNNRCSVFGASGRGMPHTSKNAS